MKKAFITLTVVVLLATMMTAVTACNKAKEGELPTLEVGNQWVSRLISEGIEYTMTIEVTGEDIIDGKHCYIMEGSFEPPVGGLIGSSTAKFDKSTMDPIRMQMSGEYMSLPYIVAASYSYEYPGALPYPLEVGKEYEVTETETTSMTMLGETITETTVNTYIYRVEKVEEITVPAGTFRCFKVVKYDETGTTALETQWCSDKTKQYVVKRIDHESGDTTELLSYSV